MRRRLSKLDEIIDLLESIEPIRNMYAESQRNEAIACLKNYKAEREIHGDKTMKIREKTNIE